MKVLVKVELGHPTQENPIVIRHWMLLTLDVRRLRKGLGH